MDAGIAIFTAARRYCLERYSLWVQRYAAIIRERGDRAGSGYTPEAFNTFPRYNVLNAIRVDLERLNPETMGDFEAARELAVLAGETADDDFTRNPSGAVERQAMAAERAALRDYVLGLTRDDLARVEPLPFRRVLGAGEARTFWEQLRARWQIAAGPWYPLDSTPPPGVAAFDATAFDQALPPDRLQHLLHLRGVTRVYELREYGPEYELEVALFDPQYNGAEGDWSSGDLDWIVYASHESSVTVGGWLLDEVKALWPTWEAHIWRDVF